MRHKARRDYLKRLTRLSILSSIIVLSPLSSKSMTPPELWLAPLNDTADPHDDYKAFLNHPEEWTRTSAIVRRLSIPLNYLLQTPPPIAGRQLAILKEHRIKLDVSVPALPVDKHVCGDGIEGTVWPGEPSAYARRLRALGIEVDSFTLDLPLTAGYFSKSSQKCQFSIRDIADRTAGAVRDLRNVYPNVEIIDAEVPTGLPSGEWPIILTKWVDTFREYSGRSFDGFMMDVWWQFNWRPVARETLQVLSPRNIPVGIGINASEHDNESADSWIAAAQANACAVEKQHLPLSYFGISNWQDFKVKNLPETDPSTLTGLTLWLARKHTC